MIIQNNTASNTLFGNNEISNQGEIQSTFFEDLLTQAIPDSQSSKEKTQQLMDELRAAESQRKLQNVREKEDEEQMTVQQSSTAPQNTESKFETTFGGQAKQESLPSANSLSGNTMKLSTAMTHERLSLMGELRNSLN